MTWIDPPLKTAVPATPGAYILAIFLKARLELPNWPRGPVALESGLYFYMGSARGPGGLKARISRHLKRPKKIHWHVDHLTNAGQVLGIGCFQTQTECALAARLGLESGMEIPVAGFGSSDCTVCPAHLLYFTAETPVIPGCLTDIFRTLR